MAKTKKTGRAQHDEDPDDGSRYSLSQVLIPLGVLLVFVVILLIVLTVIFENLNTDAVRREDTSRPENTLPIALVAATVALLAALAVVVIIFARLRLTRKEHALGLPEGSIRAVIALLLLVLFFITAVFLYADSGRETRVLLENIDAARVAAIPTDQLREVQPGDEEDTFDVEFVVGRSSDSIDIAKQLVTTVSTLVVAVAAFYFGANSVQTAVRSTLASGEDEPDEPDEDEDEELGLVAARRRKPSSRPRPVRPLRVRRATRRGTPAPPGAGFSIEEEEPPEAPPPTFYGADDPEAGPPGPEATDPGPAPKGRED